jgi:lipopolysaccharide transport system permease protein
VRIANAPAYWWDTLQVLVGRELRAHFKGSFLGFLWAILSPLGTVAILQIVFSRILPLNIPNYAAFIYSGMLPWSWFDSAIQAGTTTLSDNRDLVRKPFFQRPLLPAVVISANFMLYLLALPVLAILLVANRVPLSPTILLLPVVWAVQAVFTLAATTLVAALAVLIRDVKHLVGVGMMLWFYLTPVFYDLDLVSPKVAHWFGLNPLAVIVQAHRDITLYGRMPDWPALGAWAIISLVFLAGSLLVFRWLEDKFVEEV